MKNLTTSCRNMEAELANLLLEPESASAGIRDHVAKCEGCRGELESLKATMGLMDAWEAPEPNPFFFTRLNARMREEREAEPAGWLSRVRDRFTYGPRMHRIHARPLAAMALTLMLLLGGGTYLSVSKLMQPPQQASDAVVHDLQTLDNNAQVLDTLEDLSTPSNNGD
jgi:hypothetical protein